MSWLDDLIMEKAGNLAGVPEDKFGEALGQAIREAVAEISANPQAVPERWWEDNYAGNIGEKLERRRDEYRS